jgi:hypothetical protein
MRKVIFSLAIGLIIGSVVSGFIFYNKTPTPQYIHDTIQVKIDSIQTKIDTLYIEKEYVKTIYRTKAETILNQSASDDWEYYINFLRSNFPSNSDSTQAN